MTEHDYEIDGALIAEVFKLTSTEERTPLPRHRHNLTRSQVETSQRARIIVATAEIVNEIGYAATTSRAIIERAGVSSKTFYALFGDKESAFYATYSLLDGVVLSYARNPPRSNTSAAMAVEGITAFLEQVAAVPLFTRLRMVEAPAAGRRALELQRDILREFAGTLHALISEAARDDPELTVPSEEVLFLFVGGMQQLILTHILEHGTTSLPELAPTILDALRRLIYGGPK